MENDVVSDLEEGEILENDVDSSNDSEKYEYLIKSRNNSPKKYISDEQYFNDDNLMNVPIFKLRGYVGRKLKKKLKLSPYDLNSVKTCKKRKFMESDQESSEEYDELEKHKNNYCFNYLKNSSEKIEKKYLYEWCSNDIAKDLITELDRVTCKKISFNKNKKTSKEMCYKCNLHEVRECCCNYSSLLLMNKNNSFGKKNKQYKVYSNYPYSSETNLKNISLRKEYRNSKRNKIKSEFDYRDDNYVSRKKKKKRNSLIHSSKKDIRDFDEVRKNLLKKLKEKESQMKITSTGIEDLMNVNIKPSESHDENFILNFESSVQNFNLSCSNRTENVLVKPSVNFPTSIDRDEDAEADLMQLRLMALASYRNKKKQFDCTQYNLPKVEENIEECDTSKIELEELNCNSQNTEDNDLDRNELLLRAEALKTALLKKHQKRLKNLKKTKINSEENLNIRESVTYEINENNSEICDEKEKTNTEISEVSEEKCSNKIHQEDDLKNEKLLMSTYVPQNQLAVESSFSKKIGDKNQNKNFDTSNEALDNQKNSNNFHSTKSAKNSTMSSSEMQRIIVHLGSDDSSDDDVNIHTKEDNLIFQKDNTTNEKKTDENTLSETNEIDESIKADFEKKVVQLLNEAKQKIQEEILNSKKNSKLTSEAVYKHLPPSQRLEYLILKKKIADSEKLKSSKNEISSNLPVHLNKRNLSNPVQSSNLSNKFESKCNVVNRKISIPSNCEQTLSAGDSCLNALPIPNYNVEQIAGFPGLSDKSIKKPNSTIGLIKSKHSVDQPNNNNSKLNFKTSPKKKISTLSESKEISNQINLLQNKQTQALNKLKFFLRKIKIEKAIEENYKKQITKLKAQLNLIEKKRKDQFRKIKHLMEESVKIYKLLQNMMPSVSHSLNKIKNEDEKFKLNTVEQNKERIEDKAGEKNEKKLNRILNQNTINVNYSENTNKLEKNIMETPTREVNSEMEKLPDCVISSQDNKEKELKTSTEITENEISKEDLIITKVVDACSESNLKFPSTCSESIRYNSPLEVFAKGTDNSERVNPNVIICQFDLTGTCKDDECTYQHFRST